MADGGVVLQRKTSLTPDEAEALKAERAKILARLAEIRSLLPNRGKGHRPRRFDYDLAVRMYVDDKLTSSEIARRLKVASTTVCLMLQRRGIPTRGRAHSMEGRRFGLLTVIARETVNPSGAVLWRCRCDCGNEHVVPAQRLRTGKTRACLSRACRRAAVGR